MEHLSLNPSLQNEIENENLGLPEKDAGSQGLRRKGLSRREFHGRLLHFLEMKWKDEGVATMKNGERASFTIPPNLAYGEAEQVNSGLDRAIMTMKKGEHAAVTVDTEYLRGVLNRNNRSGKLEASERKKLDGNVLFKAGKFWRASKKYEKAAKSIELNHSFTDEEMWLAKSSRLSCYLNDAACLFRRSQAYLKTSELEKAEAEADIKKALAIDPNNRYV
uniref:Rotamase n=1 Tax=Populus trichocarpa TaxID=3694 RepID=A0A2K1X9Y4_POPTR